jgi:hypothetical protein
LQRLFDGFGRRYGRRKKSSCVKHRLRWVF